MKLMWFHLMPYTELPEDFRDKHPSVWVDIHSSLFDPQRAHHMYNDFMDELEYAADCGFDAICVNEHHSNGYGLMPSPNLIAASLARRTTDTTICVMGNSLALYNPPTRGAAPTSASVDSRRRFDRDLAMVRRNGLRLFVPVVLRPQSRQGHDGWLLGGDGPAGQGPQPVPRRLRADRGGGRDPPAGNRSLHRGGRVLL